jgi:hypothetical protein
MKAQFKEFLNENQDYIKAIVFDFGKKGYLDVLYDQPKFEKLMLDCNEGTLEEEEYVNGWTDEKDELFLKTVKQFIKQGYLIL